MPLKTFGMALRALRLGYRWSDAHDCYIRISEMDGRRWRVDLAPANDILAVQGQRLPRYHIAWWDKPDVLSLCSTLENIRAKVQPVEHPWSFIVDDTGGEEWLGTPKP